MPIREKLSRPGLFLREGQQLSAEELQEHCRKDLAAYKVPKHVEFTTALPKSTIGKLLRRKLIEAHSDAEKA